MCWNKETSLLAGFFSTIVAAKSFMNGNNYVGAFIITLSLMQYLEFFLWYSQGDICLNRIFTFLIPITFFIQMFVLVTIVNTDDEYKDKENEKLHDSLWGTSSVFVLLFVCIMGYMMYRLSTEKGNVIKNNINQPLGYSYKDNESCRLTWNIYPFKENQNLLKYSIAFVANILYFYTIGVTLYIADRKDLLIAYIVTYFLAFFYNWLITKSFATVYGSAWCFLVNLISATIILIDF